MSVGPGRGAHPPERKTLPTAKDRGLRDPSARVGRPIQLSPRPRPVQVSRHLSKLFDSLCKLKFQLDENEKPIKTGLGMYSKEDEYMDFDQECDLSGQVGAGAGHGAPTGPRPPVTGPGV